MCKILFFTILLYFVNIASLLGAKESWHSSFPPQPMDLDQAITSALAAQFGAVVKGNKVPFARRLMQLKVGEIDILAGILKNEDREEYAYFLTPPYKRKTNKIFIMRKGEGKRLQRYEDLYKLRVGVQIGSKYFPRFDKDKKIHKDASTADESRFKMLLRNRFDALIHTDLYGSYIISDLGLQDKVEIAPYTYTKQNPVYMAISKKSDLYKRKDELEKVFRQMMASGEIDKVIHSYFKGINTPVPDYK